MATHSLHLSKQDTIVFTQQLALVIDSDISLYEGLKLIQTKSDRPVLVQSIDHMLEGISQGLSLSEVMKSEQTPFPDFMVTMIKIGEESGELSNTLNQIAKTYEKELETTAKVKSAVAYPLILSVLMFGVILLLIIQVLPMFNDILMTLGGDMPNFTYNIMQMSLWLGKNIGALALVLALMIVAGFLYRRTPKGRFFFDKMAFKLPIQKDISEAMTAVRFSRNLAILIRSGVNMGLGIELIRPLFKNSYVAQKLATTSQAINGGDMPAEVFEKLNLFPWVLIKLFTIAQSTGHMEAMLDKAADTMEKELDYRLDRLTTVIEPLLIIGLSAIVGVILISVILPIISIMNAIG